MEKRTRKYYRVTIHRIPPYAAINGSYYYDEDVWAYSKEGAENKVFKEHIKSFGFHNPIRVLEIPKESFKGDKVKSNSRETKEAY